MAEEFELDLIDPNPWQPRLSEDADHIANLAASIAEDDLMQVPTGRVVEDGHGGKRVQLAFGHSRLAAFKLLRDLQTKLTNQVPIAFDDESALARAVAAADRALNLGSVYESMPVHIVNLDDEGMYRFAVSENVKRRDLDSIEEAKAMQRAMQDFKYTSKQVGELFGKSESTVRGLVRLLDLPTQAQEKVRDGAISQGTARQLLTIVPLVKKESLDQIALGLAQNPGRPDYQVKWDIASALEKAKAVKMNSDNAGDGLWPLDWTFGMNMPTGKDALSGWKGPKQIETVLPGVGRPQKLPIGDVFSTIATRILEGKSRDEIVQQYPAWVDAVDHLAQIANPPTCSGCVRMAKYDGSPYCGMKACFDRKRAIWLAQELEAMSKETGIRIYDKDEDGAEQIRITEEWVWRDDHDAKARNETNKARFQNGDPDLRLGLVDEKYSQNDWLTKHRFIAVFDVSTEARAKVAAKKAKQAESEEYERNRAANREIEDKNRDQSRKFLAEVALDCFAVAFSKFDNLGVMMALARVNDNGTEDMPRAKKLQVLRRMLAGKALDHVYEWKDMLQGPVLFAEHLQGVATSWGVKLPEDWLETAARYAIDAVAVETDDSDEEGADDDTDEYDE